MSFIQLKAKLIKLIINKNMDEAIAGISGGVSGLISALVWYPLETVRNRLQHKFLEENEIKLPTSSEQLNDNIENLKKNSKISREEKSLLLQTTYLIRKIIKEEGVSGLYNGISSALVGSVQSYSIYFYMYQFWKNYFVRHNLNKNVVFDSLCTSFLGAVCTAVLTNPIWVLNTRMSQSKQKVSN